MSPAHRVCELQQIGKARSSLLRQLFRRVATDSFFPLSASLIHP